MHLDVDRIVAEAAITAAGILDRHAAK